MRKRPSTLVRVALLTMWLCACATPPTQRRDWSDYTGPGAEHFQREELEFPDVPDPLEPWNRGVAAFNRGLLFYVVSPLSTAWRFAVPQPVRSSLVRAAKNLGYPVRLVNNLLQGKFRGAGDETLRFLGNTLYGFGGLLDPMATRIGIQPSPEDFGQTLARWGWRNSTFLSLPLFGPSTVRDGIGLAVDAPLDPTFYFFPAGAAKAFVLGSEHVDDVVRLIRTHFDPYEPVRYLWVLNRRVLTTDFEFEVEEDASTETLEVIYLSFEDPWFPSRGRARQVTIPTTGRSLPYRVWMQREPAPVVFIIPGLGAHRDARSTIALAEMAFERGFSAVTLSNAFNFEFMENAATAALPGYTPVDAHDVHMALDAISRDLERRYPERITARALMGMSMGALHTLFVAAGEEAGNELVSFDRYVALYPPVRLRHGIEQLDAFYNAPLVFPEEEREERVVGILQKVVQLAQEHDFEPGNSIPLSALEAEFLIGLNFRLSLLDLIWSSQKRHDLGVLKTPYSRWRRAPASREILDYSYMEYLYAFALPYYREREPGISVAEMFARADLHAIELALRASGKVRVFSNANDFLITTEDIDWLTGVIGRENVTFYPRGGHMGNLYQPEVQRDVMDSLEDLR